MADFLCILKIWIKNIQIRVIFGKQHLHLGKPHLVTFSPIYAKQQIFQGGTLHVAFVLQRSRIWVMPRGVQTMSGHRNEASARSYSCDCSTSQKYVWVLFCQQQHLISTSQLFQLTAARFWFPLHHRVCVLPRQI